MDIRKIFIPKSIFARRRSTTRAKDNVDGIIYNDAISFVKLFQMALLSPEVRTNLVNIIRKEINNNGSLAEAVVLNSAEGVVVVESTTNNSSVIMPVAVSGQTTTIKNNSGDANIVIFPAEGQTLNGSNESTTLAAGDTINLVSLEENWITL